MKLHEFVKATSHIASGLNSNNWDQRIGEYSPDKPCCIGAHLAHWFHKDIGKLADHLIGVRETAKFLNCTEVQLAWLFHAAGAPRLPFGVEPWLPHPTEVWKNLLLIETLPPHFPPTHPATAEEKLPVMEAWLQQQRKLIHEAT